MDQKALPEVLKCLSTEGFPEFLAHLRDLVPGARTYSRLRGNQPLVNDVRVNRPWGTKQRNKIASVLRTVHVVAAAATKRGSSVSSETKPQHQR